MTAGIHPVTPKMYESATDKFKNIYGISRNRLFGDRHQPTTT